MEKKEILKNELKGNFDTLSKANQLKVVNDYNEANKYNQVFYYSNKDLIELFNNNLEEYFLAGGDKLGSNIKFITFDGNGHLKGSEWLDELIDKDQVIDWVINNWDNAPYELKELYYFDDELNPTGVYYEDYFQDEAEAFAEAKNNGQTITINITDRESKELEGKVIDADGKTATINLGGENKVIPYEDLTTYYIVGSVTVE